MKKLILSILLTASQAIAGLPPTTTKGQSDASKSTTFDFQAPLSQFTKTSGTAALIETRNFNLLANPGFEATTFSTGWTASGGSFTQGSSTNIGTGLKSAIFVPSAGSQTVTSTAVTIPYGMMGNNGEVSCSFKTSGTDYSLQAYDGSNVLNTQTIIATTNFSKQSINFIIPTSGSISLRIISGSASSSLNIDDCYLGLATNTSSTSQVTSWTAYTPTVQGFGTLTNVSVFYRIVGGNIEIQGKFQAGTVTASEGRIYLPTGYTSADTTRIATIQAVGHWWQANPTVAPGAILIEPSVTYVTLGSGSSGNNSFTKLNGSGVSASNELVGFFASVPLSGQGIGTTISLNYGPASWSGYHSTDCAWTTSSSSFADPGADASCTFTERTNRNFGTVTSAGSKLPGIVFTPPSTGRYYICALAQASNDTSSNYSAYSMTDGTTEIAQGSSRYPNIVSTPICGIYNAASVASTTIKLQLKSIAGGNAIIDGSRSNAIEWSIYSLDQAFPAPVLVGSITSQSTGALRFEFLQFGGGASGGLATSACTSTPCTIANQSGSWISSVARGSAGSYTATIAAGIFSSVPYCVGNAGLFGVATGGFANVNATNATTVNINSYSNAGTTLNDNVITLFCYGPR